MRVIKEGNPIKTKKTTPASVSCPICGFEAELDPGENITQCPCCESPNVVFTSPLVDFAPKKKSLGGRFPEDYYHFNSSGDGDCAILSEQSTAKMIDDAVREYKNTNCGYAFSSTGDTFVAVFQTDEDDTDAFLVVVSKDHYEYDVINGE